MRIRLADNWRPDAVKLYHPGDYWIPRDMTEELAQQALKQGAAVLVVEDHVKGPAPSNKAELGAPENKAGKKSAKAKG